MNTLGKWAPFINAILFSLYHFFTPWQNLTRIVALLPYIYVVWVHCLSNMSGAAVGALLLLR